MMCEEVTVVERGGGCNPKMPRFMIVVLFKSLSLKQPATAVGKQ